MSCEIIPTFPHVYTEDDTLPEIIMTLDEVDLTGFSVDLIIRRPDESELIKAATFIDATQGKFKFDFDAGDLQAGLGQLTAVRFTLGAEVEHADPFFIDVRGTP